jgi:DnaA-like protein
MSAPRSVQRGQPKTAAAIIRDLETRDLLGIAKEIARKHHVTLEELLGRRRRGPEASARHELWHRLYEEIPSLPKLGEIFGRDHTTVMAAVHKHEQSVDAAGLVAMPDVSPSSCTPMEPTTCNEQPLRPALKKCEAALSPGCTNVRAS